MSKQLIRQAIETKWLGPTNIRSARIKAKCRAKTLTIAYDHKLDPAGNHTAAARQLVNELGWGGVWFGGCLPSENYCFVDSGDYVPDDSVNAAFVTIPRP